MLFNVNLGNAPEKVQTWSDLARALAVVIFKHGNDDKGGAVADFDALYKGLMRRKVEKRMTDFLETLRLALAEIEQASERAAMEDDGSAELFRNLGMRKPGPHEH